MMDDVVEGNPEGNSRRRFIIEMILLGVFAALVGVAERRLGGVWSQSGVFVLLFGLMLWPIALIMRFISNRAKFAGLTLALLLALLIACLTQLFYPFWLDYQRGMANSPDAFPIGFPLPYVTLFFRPFILVSAAFLVGLYCSRTGFRLWKFIAGYLGALYLLASLFYHGAFFDLPSIITLFFFGEPKPDPLRFIPVWITPLLTLPFALSLILMPGQSRALERLCGFSLHPREETPPLGEKSGFFGGLVLHASLLTLVAAVAYMILVGNREMALMEIVTDGPKPVYKTPALRNAYDDLKEFFVLKAPKDVNTTATKPTSSERDNTWSFEAPKLITSNSPSVGGISSEPAEFDKAVAAIGIDKIESAFKEMEPVFAALKKARDADYCAFYEEDKYNMPNFMRLRVAAQSLEFRAQFRASQGRYKESLEDVETLLRLAWFLQDDCGTLVTIMIGVAIRGIAALPIETYYLRFQDDPERLAALLEMFDRLEPSYRLSWPYMEAARAEPGMGGPFSLYPEITLPGFLKAKETYYKNWRNLDMMRISAALSMYRLKNGEYPASLNLLKPKFLSKTLREPMTGKPFEYRLEDGAFQLRSLHDETSAARSTKTGKLVKKQKVEANWWSPGMDIE